MATKVLNQKIDIANYNLLVGIAFTLIIIAFLLLFILFTR